MYRRRFRSSKPAARAITVKFAGKCICCGGIIAAGSIAEYYPVGTIAGVSEGKLAHINAVNGSSVACAVELRNKQDSGLNSMAGDGLDERYEDQCRDDCGL